MPDKDYDFSSLQEEVELEEEKLLPKGKVIVFPDQESGHLTLLLLLLILSLVILAYVLLARFIFFSWPFN